MKILVTGATGQLGRELHRVLEANMPGKTHYMGRREFDLTDRTGMERIVSKGTFSHIINCAAYTNVNEAETEREKCNAVNADGVGSLANIAEHYGAKMIHISTDYVYDGRSNTPYMEYDDVNPLSEYGKSKLSGEMRLFDETSDGIVIRTSWLHSPYGHNFVKTMAGRCKGNCRCEVVADQIGSPTYAGDLAMTIYEILKSKEWCGGLYNFQNLGVCSWYDLAVAIYSYYGKDSSWITPIRTAQLNSAVKRPNYSVLDTNRIKNQYGIRIPHWTESLKECLKRMNQE